MTEFFDVPGGRIACDVPGGGPLVVLSQALAFAGGPAGSSPRCWPRPKVCCGPCPEVTLTW